MNFNSYLNVYYYTCQTMCYWFLVLLLGLRLIWSQTVLISVLGILQFGPTLVFLDASCDETQPRGPF